MKRRRDSDGGRRGGNRLKEEVRRWRWVEEIGGKMEEGKGRGG